MRVRRHQGDDHWFWCFRWWRCDQHRVLRAVCCLAGRLELRVFLLRAVEELAVLAQAFVLLKKQTRCLWNRMLFAIGDVRVRAVDVNALFCREVVLADDALVAGRGRRSHTQIVHGCPELLFSITLSLSF